MSALSQSQIRTWLEELQVEYTLCDQCDGLHIKLLTEQAGVYDCKVELMDGDLYWVAAFEVAPVDLFQLQASLASMSMNYPELKFFIEMDNSELPRLLAMHTLFTQTGISQEQFEHWLNRLTRQTSLLSQELSGEEQSAEEQEMLSVSVTMLH
ncbi:YbjN domain-containing protein [Paraferrimonas sedimenticola]|uniref:YbjN domain-containing protein n=1 Tax=Paraferrimonas sedimenticola TaxID=375674 RepID=A0AA37RZN5_9GAMM|nr:YbjN domain-containing protein [Paraferrimonas sedimenticola]GLP97859.1 hypothetical protein GCM10007895_31660 [Paraferrimonas sedimenticola]